MKEQQREQKNPEKNWVVNFLNLPHPDQIDFLYRYSLDEKIRKDLEKEIFDD